MGKKNEIVVGITFFAALSVLSYFTIAKGDLFDTREYYSITVRFSNVEGLEPGSNVLVNGVEAGKVQAIELDEEGDVIVLLRMFSYFTVYKNYRIMIKNVSALGGRFISIYPGSSEVDGVPQETVTGRKNLNGLSSGDPITLLAELLTENRDDIRKTIVNVRQFSESLNSGKGTLGKLLNDSEIHNNTNKLLKELRETVEDAREQAPVTSFIRAALTAF
jgi:phospholipid/cholesterol/gamma-HCH transport system substrate-binding protein